jgi:hypothetical protein
MKTANRKTRSDGLIGWVVCGFPPLRGKPQTIPPRAWFANHNQTAANRQTAASAYMQKAKALLVQHACPKRRGSLAWRSAHEARVPREAVPAPSGGVFGDEGYPGCLSGRKSPQTRFSAQQSLFTQCPGAGHWTNGGEP